MPPSPPPSARFTEAEDDAAHAAWRFNCGPGSVCLLYGLSPQQVRPAFAACGFERKGYTNPTLMYGVLRALGHEYRLTRAPETGIPLTRGLARIQWDGPWCAKGVPPRAAYRHTHWVAFWWDGRGLWIGDVNAAFIGGWLESSLWAQAIVPRLLADCEPKASGLWWPAHVLEVADAA